MLESFTRPFRDFVFAMVSLLSNIEIDLKGSFGSSSSARTVGRAVQLLRLVASSQTINLRLIDIAAMASLDKSTAHRLLQRLVHERMLTRDRAHGYRLGPLLYELGLATLPSTNLREVSQTSLQTLALSTGDMVFLVGRSGFESVCLDRIAGNFPIQTMTRAVGDRHPLGVGAGGLAILASLNDSDVRIAVEAVAPQLHRYKMSKTDLLNAVSSTRLRGGQALDEGSAALGVTAIGRTVFDRARSPVAAVFIASIRTRMTEGRLKNIDEQLVKIIKRIEIKLLR